MPPKLPPPMPIIADNRPIRVATIRRPQPVGMSGRSTNRSGNRPIWIATTSTQTP